MPDRITAGENGRVSEEHDVGIRPRPAAPPFGVRPDDGGANFAVVSRHGTTAQLVLAEAAEAARRRIIDLDPTRNRSGDVWHVWVAGVRAGWAYAWRMAGPTAPQPGDRFHPERSLLDPRAEAVAAAVPDEGIGRSALLVADRFDWRGDAVPCDP